MNWSNVKLILAREVRDQLRDRRTIFMIAVLPLLLYPLLGMSFFQVTQFMREHEIRVLVIGAPQDAKLPELVEKGHFSADLFTAEHGRAHDLMHVTARPHDPAQTGQTTPLERARRDLESEGFDVVVYVPPDFDKRYAHLRATLAQKDGSADAASDQSLALPNVGVYPNLANDSSKVAFREVIDVVDRWREKIGQRNLESTGVPAVAARPFKIEMQDVAEEGQHKAAVWSKILPFVLLIWALTGAFYPAIDLCAGEKERGTLETLLSSPAERLEIVWGKLLTVMLFSIVTALLNLTSLTITGSLVLSQLPNLGPPPTLAIVWLVVALVPVSALFSALCLALAVFARSTKEGQYYLMPLMLVTLPLVILPMAPGVDLNLGNSLIPITGVVLLLRSMLEGNYLAALPYTPVVIVVTLCCCWLAIRWATDQFNKESVLFRESERWDLGIWVRHLVRDRQETPSFAEAVFCGVLILLIKFFMGFSMPTPQSFADLASLAAATQLVVVLTPAILMAVMLTRNPARTLLLRRTGLLACLAAVALAVVLHPAENLLQSIVQWVYPLNEQIKQQLAGLNFESDNLWLPLLVFALLPAVCEELAFRGFILSGLRHMGHKWPAIVISSVFFGAVHAFFQQSISACLLGMILGFLAVQTGSLLPCVLFHATHNALALSFKSVIEGPLAGRWATWFVQTTEDGLGFTYLWPAIVGSVFLSGGILYWFHRLPYTRTPEETLQEAIEHQSANWMPS